MPDGSPGAHAQPGPDATRDEAIAAVRAHLTGLGLEFGEEPEGVFTFSLPGERKLRTPIRLDVGPHALSCHAFVCRDPDENHEGVYRWLLQRNLRMYAVAFAVDRLGDIYLDARLPLSLATGGELDRLLGSVLTYADESFNTILELGFGSAIRKEWDWRHLRGESTANLEAFRGWLEASAGEKHADQGDGGR